MLYLYKIISDRGWGMTACSGIKKLSGACTLDCFDACKFNVYVKDNKVIKVEGDSEHPYTKGFICSKGRKHIERLNHPKRQYSPLLKVNGVWKEISFDEALNIMADKLSKYKEKHGSKSIIYYEQYGSGSLLKSIGDLFFNFFGGCSKQKGGPCWSAGMKAQKHNFGDARSHSLEDMLNSKTIIVWGKNPAYTSIHTMNMLKKAKEQGSYLIVIDPICTATAKQADYYVQVKPGGDAALALAMGKIIIEKEKYDSEYISKYVNNFDGYKEYVQDLSLIKLCEEAGVTKDIVEFIVDKYTELYSTILLGYGLQKYFHGGNTIWNIDTLAAITGQIGVSGGGVNYANKVYPGILNTDPYNSERFADNQEFYVSNISSFIRDNNIKMIIITKSNLLNQLPGLNDLKDALEKIEFKVCFDLFLTDTVEECDLFIPSTSVFESEDLQFSSMTNPYITYIEKAVEPKEPLMDEYAFFAELAKRLHMDNYPQVSKNEYLTKVIEPLRKINPQVSLEYIKDNYFTIHEKVAWSNKEFLTHSGKFEILFDKDLLKSKENIRREKYNFRILTNHGMDSLFSQHYMDKEDFSQAYINGAMASKYGFEDGELVYLESDQGRIQTRLKIDNSIGDKIVMMYAGWWKKHGNPNWILHSDISDIGGQVTYNDNFVSINKKIEINDCRI